MMGKRCLVVQTAFLGDVILTLPVMQVLRRQMDAEVSAVVIPAAASIVENHPDVASVFRYDKHGSDRGIAGFLRLVRKIRQLRCDIAVIPHRSLRSALLAACAGIPHRIGFSRSAGKWFLTDIVPYRHAAHEIDRNLDLLAPLHLRPQNRVLPVISPNPEHDAVVMSLLGDSVVGEGKPMIAVAPGSVWATKRWPQASYAVLVRQLVAKGYVVVLVGGAADAPLCSAIGETVAANVVNAAGKLSLMESAALLRRCRALVTNDTAPQHLAVAVGTPVVAIFGPTVPAFGFAPAGPHDVVVEVHDVACRPCAIHGGPRCPIGTFVCMEALRPGMVLDALETMLRQSARQ